MNHLMIFTKHGVFITSTASWTVEVFFVTKSFVICISQTRGMREKAANGRSFHPGQVHGAFGGHNDCTLGHQLDTPESFCEWNPPKNDTPRKMNMEPENTSLEIRKIIFQTLIFRFYVNLPGCNGLKPPGNSEHFRFYGKIFGSRVYPIPLPFGFFFFVWNSKGWSFPEVFTIEFFLLGCPVGSWDQWLVPQYIPSIGRL